MLDVPREIPADGPDRAGLPSDERPFGPDDLLPVPATVWPVYDWVPEGIETMEPGPVLAGLLSGIDVSTVSGSDRIVVLRAHQRLVSHFQAQVYCDMVAVTDAVASDPEEPIDDPLAAAEAAAAEIGVALHLSRTVTDGELAFALDLKRRLPSLAEMLAAGSIDVRRARTIDRHTRHLSDDSARAVLDEVLDEAPGLTAGQLRVRIRKLCIEVEPAEALKRYEAAVADRRVVTESNDSGTVNLLGMDLAPDQVVAVSDRINMIARGMRGDGESRSMDQIRADIYVDLLTGANHQTTRRGVVDIRVDLTTLVRLDDKPGDLAGFGPVIADVARRVVDNARDAEWRVTITDPSTGQPTHVGTTSRRPTAAQRRRIETRNQTCIFPGCRMPASRSDIDHRISVEDGGRTTDENLAPLCRHHHRIKHQHKWTYQRSDDGSYVWVTGLGQIVTTARPPP